ncbi:MAG: hypothetical protein M0C28_40685 [Candidatus Moduliflexus flocculans]|nr:hypothetical protein [Candidatus Moduliflexus flocculans]
MRDKCARKWTIPHSVRTRIGESTIKEWVARYKASGNKLESLVSPGTLRQGQAAGDRRGDGDGPQNTP